MNESVPKIYNVISFSVFLKLNMINTATDKFSVNIIGTDSFLVVSF